MIPGAVSDNGTHFASLAKAAAEHLRLLLSLHTRRRRFRGERRWPPAGWRRSQPARIPTTAAPAVQDAKRCCVWFDCCGGIQALGTSAGDKPCQCGSIAGIECDRKHGGGTASLPPCFPDDLKKRPGPDCVRLQKPVW